MPGTSFSLIWPGQRAHALGHGHLFQVGAGLVHEPRLYAAGSPEAGFRALLYLSVLE